MKKSLLFFLLLISISANAQNHSALKDSLSKAVDVLAYHPDSIDLRLKKASWNMELQQWNYAKDEYDEVLKLNPKNIAALYYRAFANEKLKRYNFARLDYENLLALVPGNFEVQLGLALLNQKDQHYTEAFDQINSLVSQYPDSAVVFAARGGIEKERGMLELAEYDYSEAIKRDAHNTDYRLNRVDILLTLGKKDEAKSDLDDLVKSGISRANLIDFYKRLRK